LGVEFHTRKGDVVVSWNPLHLHFPSVVDRIQRKARRTEPSTRGASTKNHDRNDYEPHKPDEPPDSAA
jgi:hypothetical protein